MQFDSSVYGLRVRANVPIPGLAASDPNDEVDVWVYLGSRPANGVAQGPWEARYAHPQLDERGRPLLVVAHSHNQRLYRLTYADGTEFNVDEQGSQIWATWSDPLTLDDTATYLLNPVLAFVLRLRGVVSLHASALRVGQSAIVFVGASGAGKSTTAAAFAMRGQAVLADDVVPILRAPNGLIMQPAYPRLRLWPKSVQTLFGASDALPLLTPTWDKRFLDLSAVERQFSSDPLPLSVVYVLDERSAGDSAPRVEPLDSKTAFMQLVANTYVNYLLDADMRAHEFSVLGELVSTVPVRRVVPHADPSRLEDLCETILEDCQMTNQLSGASAHAHV